MKTNKYHLILAAVIAIVSVFALADTELPPPIKQQVIGEPPFEAGVIGQAHQTLFGIDELYVFIQRPSADPNKDGLVWKELRAKVEHKLTEAGIKMYSGNVRGWPLNFETPILTIDIDMLKLKELKRYVFNTQTSLSRPVHLPIRSMYTFKADVWKKNSRMRTITAEYMPPEVTGVVMGQVEAFIHAYLAANPKAPQTPDSNDVVTTAKERILRPLPKPTPAKFNYVASKNSKVFHRPTCSSAMRIAPKNLVGYNTRQEAINAGKRPCKICKP